MSIVSIIIGLVIGSLVTGFIIWIVSKLGLGLEVSGFRLAFIAAIVIAVINGIVNAVLGALGINIAGGLIGGIVQLVIAAIVLMLSGSLLPGLQVKGFQGAIIAAIAIGVVGWLLALALKTLIVT